jgi:hypothetical protein
MLLHIATRRNIALSLIERGIVTQAEAAHLLGESRQAVRYMARDIDAPAARANYLSALWIKEAARPPRKKRTPLKRKVQQ